MAVLRKKGVTAILKVAISLLLLYFVFKKIDYQQVWGSIRNTVPHYLLFALIAFVLSKFIAAFRLNLYLHHLKILLSHISNLKLYLLGMFYNLFLPGGIGGDAYKGYLIKKKYGVETKRIIAIMVLDRLSGLLLLFVFACILTFFLEQEIITRYQWLSALAMGVAILFFWLLNKRFFNYVYPVFWNSLWHSALVQLFQLLAVFFIWKALNVDADLFSYLFLFLVSSIVAVLPITIGGIGSREVVFLYGALWLGLEEKNSVSISVIFFLITALVSLIGIVYHFRKPQLDTLDSKAEINPS